MQTKVAGGGGVADSAVTRLRALSERLGESDGPRRIDTALADGESAIVDGVWGAARALMTAAIAQVRDRRLVVVCPTAEPVDDWLDDVAVFADLRAESFPAIEALEGERIVHDELYGARVRLLKRLRREDGPPVVVTSIQALLQPVPDVATLDKQTRTLAVGDSIPMETLTRWLAEGGFHATTAVELPTEFSARGGLLDIFAPDWTQPVRVEFFGDQIESLRMFDVATQRGTMPLERVDLTVLAMAGRHASHLADHIPPNTCFVLIEPGQIEKEGRSYLERLKRPRDLHSVTAVFRRIMEHPTVSMTELAEAVGEVAWNPRIGSVERFGGKIDEVRSQLEQVEPGQNVHLVCQTEAEAKRLAEVFGKTRLAIEGRLHLPIGRLTSGFCLLEHGEVVLSSAQVFGRGDPRRTTRRRLGRTIDSFVDLRPGNLVVHLAHGIGRYRGIRLIEKGGRNEEHLEIEFAEGAKVYVPSSKIGLVQKYIAGSKARPKLARIGGQLWMKRKKLVEKAVIDLAAEMIELQAAREQWPGIPFPQDTAWQSEFDAAFPYEETMDQFLAIEAVKQDMTRPRPMDRLICGDVGFGKTEIAMRAVFKAVDAGYQAAVLVPTTVLAEQHFRTFSERMAEFPFEIAVLSRFATKRQQADTIKRLASGAVDVVIGTHRLAQKDVQFQNLGLVVIDEEQRFGVEVKERLKAIRNAVDVLTMTATPIPRTLHMALVGIRHISNLTMAPEDRVAVETRVTRFSSELIRHAFLRELNRGGQIFFVHNRVRDIDRVKKILQRIVPEARIEIGHAQMPEQELERVMLGFVRHEFDVLLSTTIVESGLDIPNANTIFIDEAERFGLSDLHQLRGRVGRYKHQAYCYLLVGMGKTLTPVAARRLHAIEEFCELGAGFALAMRDLEIRGAGNILGTQQSGHIALVGYELYCQLLENAVRKLRRMPAKESIEVDLELPGDAYLPDAYVQDMRSKIDLYRRLSRVTTEEELADYRAELSDRFGSPPPPAEMLLTMASLRVAAHARRVARVYLEEDFLVFQCQNGQATDDLLRGGDGRLRKVDALTACLTARAADRASERLLEIVKSVLRPRG